MGSCEDPRSKSRQLSVRTILCECGNRHHTHKLTSSPAHQLSRGQAQSYNICIKIESIPGYTWNPTIFERGPRSERGQRCSPLLNLLRAIYPAQSCVRRSCQSRALVKIRNMDTYVREYMYKKGPGGFRDTRWPIWQGIYELGLMIVCLSVCINDCCTG